MTNTLSKFEPGELHVSISSSRLTGWGLMLGGDGSQPDHFPAGTPAQFASLRDDVIHTGGTGPRANSAHPHADTSPPTKANRRQIPSHCSGNTRRSTKSRTTGTLPHLPQSRAHSRNCCAAVSRQCSFPLALATSSRSKRSYRTDSIHQQMRPQTQA